MDESRRSAGLRNKRQVCKRGWTQAQSGAKRRVSAVILLLEHVSQVRSVRPSAGPCVIAPNAAKVRLKPDTMYSRNRCSPRRGIAARRRLARSRCCARARTRSFHRVPAVGDQDRGIVVHVQGRCAVHHVLGSIPARAPARTAGWRHDARRVLDACAGRRGSPCACVSGSDRRTAIPPSGARRARVSASQNSPRS